ncbi:fibroblast growth factor receptor 2-like [Pollicipes pollicipes]|uniref:fibroblast growth factor receptor 2-like n=1 Tax=Pollicipes pollicipes TaxID=41117 RepID=UPI001885915C|nr:fibroblast growth factor receptor 2-like [Pollicipes pollicipes]
MAPLPILLSTLPAPFRAGLITAPPLRRNFTVSVTFPPTSQTTVRTGGRSPGGGGAAVTSAGQPAGRVLGTSLQTSVSVAVSPLEFKLRKRVSLAQAANEARGRDAGDSVAAGKRQGSDAQRAGGGRASGEVSEGDTARTSGPSGESSALPELDDPPAPSTTTERSRNASTTQTYSPTPEQSFDQFTVRAPRLSLAEVAAAADASNRTRHTSPTSTASSHWQEEDELVQRVLDAGPTSSTAPPSAASSPLPSVGRRRPAVREVFAEEVLLTEEAESRPLYLVSLLFVLPVVAVALWYLKKNHLDMRQLVPQRLKSMLGPDSSDVTRDDVTRDDFYLPTEETSSKVATMLIQDTLARRRKWEHDRQRLRLQAVLGEGHFGQVWRAEADGVRGHEGTLLVAVKNVKDSASAKDKQDLLRELRIMQNLGSHPNVVTLLGCCTEEDPVLVVMEYVVFGKLLTYLRENRGRHNYFNFSHDSAVLTSRDLTLFACQAAAGMEYIAAQGIVHRDLAARNILVDHNKVCKVSDFGMSRSQQEISSEVFEQKHRGALPIRWMSPESLYHNTFNQKTDCWSFGILLWEIITLGSTPYPGLSAREVMRSVREGYRLERPDHCHPQLYQLAASCWAAEPSWRPSFAELRNDLEVLLEDQNQGYVDLDRFQEEIYGTLHKSSDEKV